ncbi:uncharacterized protein LOC130824965 [Amaranthus tricolor]|uniref:uncharacterized protein LOC130824965 n=1 Tax=Amaranthus tricolor TaxID=29722 RepID=UPI002586A3B2|nr:uncharacterized protein LOC130824965 [Amaranthus tricolor]
MELEHKAQWAIKTLNFDLKATGSKRLLDINELYEIRLDTYESALLYKEKKKRWHDQRLNRREFKIGVSVQGPTNTFKVSGHRAKHYHVGEPIKASNVLYIQPS